MRPQLRLTLVFTAGLLSIVSTLGAARNSTNRPLWGSQTPPPLPSPPRQQQQQQQRVQAAPPLAPWSPLDCGSKPDTFQCPDELTCIREALVCNGRDDCGDGADEANCLNNNTAVTPSRPQWPCGNNSFRCASNQTCVPSTFVCDKVRDCDDFSDESDCADKAYEEYLNQRFTKRHDVDLESLPFCDDEQLAGCRCSPEDPKFYCLRVGLRNLTAIPVNATFLDVSGNQLTLITPTILNAFTQLTVLIMSSCQITGIDDGTFDELRELKNLRLSGNNITTIGLRTFGWISNLEKLQLSYNPLVHIEAGAFSQLNQLTYLDLRHCALEELNAGMLQNISSLRYLYLDNNAITTIDDRAFDALRDLRTLSIGGNRLVELRPRWFAGLGLLQVLDVMSNQIKRLDFRLSLPSLKMLNVNNNGITFVSEDAFSYTPLLSSLNMRQNPLTDVGEIHFRHLTKLNNAYFSDFAMCLWVPNARVCSPRGDGISSLNHLLDNVILRVSVWLVALIACFGNLLVLIGRLLFREPNRVHSFYIKNLALSDLLMGAYLLIIAAHDVHFRGEYIRHDFRWRHSFKCAIAGALAAISSEASVFTLTVITVDRFASILYPLSTKKRTVSMAWTLMGLAWLAALLIAVFPLTQPERYGQNFYGSNGVCLPLHLHNPFSQGWEYSALIFCTINSVAFAFIAYAYVCMFLTITDSRLNLRSTQQLQDRAIAKRFAFIVATDFLCWMPIAIIKVVALLGTPINETLYAWVAVFLLPVNSALNPVLYTLTTRLFRQQLSRYLWSLKPLQFRGRRNSKKTLVTTLSDQPAHCGGRLASIKLNGHTVKHAHLQQIDQDQLNQKLREQFV